MFDTIRCFLWRVWLWATTEQRIDRFNKLTKWHSEDPFDYGLLPSAKELEYEHPKVNLNHREDVIDFFLQNSKQQCLFARISRLGNGESACRGADYAQRNAQVNCLLEQTRNSLFESSRTTR